MNNFH